MPLCCVGGFVVPRGGEATVAVGTQPAGQSAGCEPAGAVCAAGRRLPEAVGTVVGGGPGAVRAGSLFDVRGLSWVDGGGLSGMHVQSRGARA